VSWTAHELLVVRSSKSTQSRARKKLTQSQRGPYSCLPGICASKSHADQTSSAGLMCSVSDDQGNIKIFEMKLPPNNTLAEASSTLGVQHLHIDSHFVGCSHDIFVLASPSGQKWSQRVARDDFAALIAERSIPIMRHISDQRPMLSIPSVVDHAPKYTLLGYIEGSPITSWNSNTLTEPERHLIPDGLAIFLNQLWACPVEDVTSGKGILTDDLEMNYHDWLLHEVDQAICRSIRNPGWGHPINFLRRRLRVKDVVPCQGIPRLAIKHGDMNALNVLVHRGELSGLVLSYSHR